MTCTHFYKHRTENYFRKSPLNTLCILLQKSMFYNLYHNLYITLHCCPASNWFGKILENRLYKPQYPQVGISSISFGNLCSKTLCIIDTPQFYIFYSLLDKVNTKTQLAHTNQNTLYRLIKSCTFCIEMDMVYSHNR